MPNTYTQIHLQFVFAVKYRQALIAHSWKQDLHKYITGIFQQNDHKMLQINSMPDHIHILIGMRPNQSISSLIQNVKTESSKWINSRQLCNTKFNWQEPSLYHATIEVFFDIVSRLSDDHKTVAIFSHNPTITEFANELKVARIDDMPTCALFGVKADIKSWKDFKDSEKKFWFFDYPKNES